ESTRPGAAHVWEGDEIARAEPVVRRLARAGAIVSIDTRKSAVMAAALAAGATIVNDVSALDHDPQSALLLAGQDCPVVLMHHQGEPATMQQRPHYDDALIEIYDWLAERIAFAEAAGIARSRIIGALSNEAPVDQRLGGSVALALHGAQMGVQLLRVHDVPETLQAIRIWRGLRDEALTPG
ncbi:MAG: dihydropteroate synthase, partial [Sphingomonadales bacterium]